MADPTEIKISLPELVNDPVWRGAVATIDGAQHRILSIDLPRHGTVHILFAKESARTLADWLQRTLAEPTMN